MSWDRRKLVRDRWYKVIKADHVPEWDSLDTFEAWHEREGGAQTRGLVLRRYDPKKPYGPRNCYLQKLNVKDEDPDEVIIKWNKTVNVLRRAAGLPLFKEE